MRSCVLYFLRGYRILLLTSCTNLEEYGSGYTYQNTDQRYAKYCVDHYIAIQSSINFCTKQNGEAMFSTSLIESHICFIIFPTYQEHFPASSPSYITQPFHLCRVFRQCDWKKSYCSR